MEYSEYMDNCMHVCIFSVYQALHPMLEGACRGQRAKSYLPQYNECMCMKINNNFQNREKVNQTTTIYFR